MSDKDLVRQVIENGQTKGFEAIVKRYSGLLYSKALGVLHQGDLAADVVQQTFIKAYANLDTWRGNELGPWLNTIAMHLSLNMLEKERRRRVASIETQPGAMRATAEEYSPERERMLQRMEKAISQLSDDDQRLIRMHYYDHLKTDEIADKMRLTQSNVLVRLHRVRERLRKQLNDERNG